ncbi:MAG: 4Fe-4S dicluster domain-containing protein [bacterium]|nr:4Fe-4S dicluster domain-containing protein [bacterium]
MSDLDRRDFLKIVGMTAGAAATVACKEPVEKIVPYLNQPEEIVPGLATYYNSTCRECPAACGITVKTREGRPIKVDGNPDDPISQGALCVRGQASLHRTYDSTRFRGPMRRDADGALQPTTWDEGIALLVEKLRGAPGKVFFLGDGQSGTLDELIDKFLAEIGSPNRLRYEPFAYEALREANRVVFGTDAVPDFRLDKADVVVAFGTDFIETWLSPLQNQIRYTASREGGKGFTAFVGPRLGLSGSNAEQWIAPEPGTEIQVALALAHEVAQRKGTAGVLAPLLSNYSLGAVAVKTGIDQSKLQALAERIASASSPLALPPGAEVQGTNAAAFAAAVQILNHVSGAVGNTVVFGPNHNVSKLARFADLKELAGQLRGGDDSVLLVHNANPVYNAPQVGFGDAMGSGSVFTVSFSSANDETTALADLVLPDHTPFESWGDPQPISGIRRLQQPTIRPLFDTRALGDLLLEIGRALGKGGSLPAGGFRDQIKAKWGAGFDAQLAKGGEFGDAPAEQVSLSSGISKLRFEAAELAGDAGGMALVVYPSLHFYDGRSARFASLNEVPDPVLKTMWGSYAEINEDEAHELGIQVGDVVKISTDSGSVEVTAYPHAAIRKGVVALQIGQGQMARQPDAPAFLDYRAKREVTGVNALSLVPGRLDGASGALAFLSTRASVSKTGARGLVTRAQLTFGQENRGMAKAATLAALAKADSGHGDGHGEVHAGDAGDSHAKKGPIQGDEAHLVRKEYDAAKDSHPESPYRWGMNIDLDKCSGCNSCTVACNVENNLPTVGPENARIGREMHWIRIERYVETADDQVDVRFEPMMCQHCGAAPCESVCPAIATYHNPEGLNVMVPNRCLGTRFCSNNCPYKARRFNHRPYDLLYEAPEELILNPDVTVRGKGVMEKCTLCVHRIAEGRDEARKKGRNVQDGDFTIACAQACPSKAITFGNLKEESSEVAKLRHDKRAYRVLEHLYTRPGVSYQKKILRNEKA